MQLFTLLIALALPQSDTPWPAWRGPDGDGTSAALDLPVRWSTEENVRWRVPLPSWSGATPIVAGGRVFVMSPSASEAGAEQPAPEGGGRRRGGRDPGGDELLLLCFEAESGKALWRRKLAEGNKLWRKGNNTSPSPVSDGRHVWTVTGTGVVTALDLDGAVRWTKDLQADYGEFGLQWGYASSPLLFEGKLVVEVLHGSYTDEDSYLLALDASTGEVVWRVDRPTDAPRESPDAYTTPLVVEREGGPEIVVSGGDYVTGHDPATGEELWRVAGLNPRKAPNYRIVASPLALDGLLIVPTRVRPLTALAIDGEGPPTEDAIVWQWEQQGAPDVPSPTTDGTYLYLLDDAGLVTCVDPATGEAIWGPERTGAGTVSSSAVCADGKLYFTDEDAVTVVLRAGPRFELLATNALDGGYTLSSPAVAGRRLYLRTEKYLYCIGAE